MRIQVLSDTHLEFHRDGGRTFLEELDPRDVDVLVLAGDICSASMLVDVLGRFAALYPRVLMVSGNHEHYGTTLRAVERALARAEAAHRNVIATGGPRWLEIDGRRFLLATLWFRDEPGAPREWLTDFKAIRGDFDRWVYQRHAAAVKAMADIRPGDVVVTHHLPTYRSVAQRFVGSPVNVFFATELEQLIRERKPALWLHGHTHDACDHVLGETRIVCNPYGYFGHEVFSPEVRKVVIEV